MKVRVFVPRAPAHPADPAGRPGFSGTDHYFPLLPHVGHILRFDDEGGGEYSVARVGFVQAEDGFIGAIWLESLAGTPVYHADPVAEGEPQGEYRDLNHDVPPDTMTTY